MRPALTFVRKPPARVHILRPTTLATSEPRTVCGVAILGFGWDQGVAEPKDAAQRCGNCDRMRDSALEELKTVHRPRRSA